MQNRLRRELVPEEVEDRRFLVRPGENRRKSPRQRTLLSGYITLIEGDQLAEVVVRNLSESGARLSLKVPAPAAGEFLLCIPTRSIATAARIVWANGTDMGVQFKPPGEDYADRLAKLLSALRR